MTLEAKAPPSRTCSTVAPSARRARATRLEIVVLPLPSIPSKTTNIPRSAAGVVIGWARP